MKLRKFAVLFLVVCFAVLPASACGSMPSESEKETQTVVVNAFDTQTDFDTMQLCGLLGKSSLNTDARYVKSGKGSMQVTVASKPLENKVGFLYQGMRQDNIGRTDLSDFAAFDNMRLQIYNTSTESKRVGIRLVYVYDQDGNTESTTTWYTLQPEWNAVVYNIDRTNIPVGESGIRKVAGVSLYFDRDETDTVYYLDEWVMHRTKKTVPDLVMTVEPNEICSFDKKWQVEQLERFQWVPSYCQPDFTYNTDLQYTVNGAGGSLKVMLTGGNGGNYPGFFLNRQLTKAFDFGRYGKYDCLCYDVYTPEENGVKELNVLLHVEGYEYFVGSTPLVQGGWTHVEWRVEDIESRGRVLGATFADVRYISFTAHEATYDRLYYLDNIRMKTDF